MSLNTLMRFIKLLPARTDGRWRPDIGFREYRRSRAQGRVRKFQRSVQGATPVNPSVRPAYGYPRPHRSEQEIDGQ
jgi:hypothetical protein